MRGEFDGYAGYSMDLADAGIVRMSELIRERRVITVDRSDFAVYRRNSRETIPTVMPLRSERQEICSTPNRWGRNWGRGDAVAEVFGRGRCSLAPGQRADHFGRARGRERRDRPQAGHAS